MTITHHPDGLTLMGYVAGSLGEPLSAVVASHLDLCPRCRVEVGHMEGLGLALMAAAADAPLAGVACAPGPAAATGQGGAGVAAAPTTDGCRPAGDPIPAPLRRRWGIALPDVRWRRLGRGIWHHRLPLSPGASGRLQLLKVDPRMAIPEHGHTGSELTLVLQGGFEDATGHYLAGDVQDVGDGVEHQPRADDEGCICLVASDGPIRFSALGLRIIQAWRRL